MHDLDIERRVLATRPFGKLKVKDILSEVTWWCINGEEVLMCDLGIEILILTARPWVS